MPLFTFYRVRTVREFCEVSALTEIDARYYASFDSSKITVLCEDHDYDVTAPCEIEWETFEEDHDVQ